MVEPFTADQIEQLSSEINEQLRELAESTPASLRGGRPPPNNARRQLMAIEQSTSQDVATFLARFRIAARNDLCAEGGILHAQWQRFHDLTRKDMLKTFGGILVGMGIAGNALATAAVAISVYILYLGIEAFCAGEE
jgi:hypothetical protein